MDKAKLDNDYLMICYQIAEQEQRKQNAIMESLKAKLGEDEYKSILIGVSFCRLYTLPELKKAMMTALSEELYKEFNKGVKT